MGKTDIKWFYLVLLSLVWGSSFILIKKGLIGLTPVQVGAIRVLIASVFLFLIGFTTLKKINREQWKWIAVAGTLGTFIPAFLFAYAQTEIDSAITSILNATTPLMTVILGALLFSIPVVRQQLFGVMVGLVGCVLLIFQSADVNPDQNYWFAFFVVIATLCYATNVNIIKARLKDLSPLAISTGSFLVIMLPSFVVLGLTGFFSQEIMTNQETLKSIGYVSLLAIFGTALALLVFNKLIQISTPVFSTSVTYTIPIVALLWGILDGERFTIWQGFAAAIIILGVIIANRKRQQKKKLPPV